MACVVGAGMATGLGAAVVFSDRAIQLANKKVLAGCLGLASGVMLYVSFLDIFSKSLDEYSAVDGRDENVAYALATLTFFSGFALYAVIGMIVHYIDPDSHSHDIGDYLGKPPPSVGEPTEDGKPIEMVAIDGALEGGISPAHLGTVDSGADLGTEGEKRKLAKMGLMTALAISIHNFPEGLLTFVGYIADPAVGASLAIAIGIHNVPEGLCVAIPVYYATGSRWKAFGWAMISGFSEVLGGALGWAVLANVVGPNVYGFLFGMVGGMMVMICISELIPTAIRYDPQDEVTSKSIIAGMAIMALSLIMLNQPW
jgi:ZIP family zinc transporter